MAARLPLLPTAAGKLIEQVKREFGALDILVNNAGATKRATFWR